MAYEIPGLTEEELVEAVQIGYGVTAERARRIIARERGELGSDVVDILSEHLSEKQSTRPEPEPKSG